MGFIARDRETGNGMKKVATLTAFNSSGSLPAIRRKSSRPGWENVKFWFEVADVWPLSNYTPYQSRAREHFQIDLVQGHYNSTLVLIQYMESD
jgi:hypothetical protein